MGDLEARARSFFDLAHARDDDALAALYTPDAQYVRSDGVATGPNEIVAYLRGIMSAFPDHAARVDGVIVADDAVTLEWTETATHTAPYEGAMGTIAPTGKSFEVKVVEVFRFEGDRIKSQHEYYDLLSLMSQVGWL